MRWRRGLRSKLEAVEPVGRVPATSAVSKPASAVNPLKIQVSDEEFSGSLVIAAFRQDPGPESGLELEPLVGPHRPPRDAPQRPLPEGLVVLRFEEEDPLLEIRSQEGQPEELGQTRPGHPLPPGHLGLVPDLPRIDRLLDPVGQGEHDGDAGGPWDGSGWWFLSEYLPTPAADPMQLPGDGVSVNDGPHAMAPCSDSLEEKTPWSPSSRSVMTTLTLLAGSSTSTRWTTARRSRPLFSGVRMSQTEEKPSNAWASHPASASADSSEALSPSTSVSLASSPASCSPAS